MNSLLVKMKVALLNYRDIVMATVGFFHCTTSVYSLFLVTTPGSYVITALSVSTSLHLARLSDLRKGFSHLVSRTKQLKTRAFGSRANTRGL